MATTETLKVRPAYDEKGFIINIIRTNELKDI